MRVSFSAAFLIAALQCTGLPAAAQDAAYPDKPVRMIVPFSAGGGVDIAARAVAAKLTDRLGQSFVVDNRPGAGGNIAMELAARSEADGYTLMMGGAGPVAMNVSLYPSLRFDPMEDFEPVALVASTVYALVVHPDLPATSVQELIALARHKPGALTFASPGVGSPPHLSMEMFQMMTGTRMLHVPYKGTGPALNDLLGGQISMYLADLIAAKPYLESGRLRGLAVTSAKRSPLAPDLPTIAEAGVPGYEATGWTGLLAPAGTSQAVIDKLGAEVRQIIEMPDVKAKLMSDNSAFGENTPRQFSAFIDSEIAKWRKVIEASGARAQ